MVKICDECETVSHCSKHGCIPKVKRPDSPCIAVCTTLYDEKCKGCGRTYLEVANWNAMPNIEREKVWQRIDTEATSWRYNKYKDRVYTSPPAGRE